MLTRELPFNASDPIHCHIARQPIPPQERVKEIPAPIAAIVLKLLAETAEERYQTAAGVGADLRKCLAEWESLGRIKPFPLGVNDISDRLLIPEKLYGREREIEALLAAFDCVGTDGTPELVLVSGYSGVGKSSVINELHEALVPPRGLFASGKFVQYKHDIPYSTLAQALQSLVRLILSQSDAELSQWRDAIRKALGQNGQLIDLPLMTEPDCRATMDVLAGFLSPALFTDGNLFALTLAGMVNLSLEHRNCDASCLAYTQLMMVLGPHLGDHLNGFRSQEVATRRPRVCQCELCGDSVIVDRLGIVRS